MMMVGQVNLTCLIQDNQQTFLVITVQPVEVLYFKVKLGCLALRLFSCQEAYCLAIQPHFHLVA